jgi:hypothetical protein
MADRVRGDGVATTGYDAENRLDAQQVLYKVKASGDRWFIPYNDNASKADQVTQCDKIVGDTDDGTVAGVESVGTYRATVTPKTAPMM